VFTQDTERGVRFALQVRAGMTHVNDSPVNDESGAAPPGHGVGRFVDSFTTEHQVSVQHTPRDFPAL
jgi:aldehyde dehydrogenase (NAD+)